MSRLSRDQKQDLADRAAVESSTLAAPDAGNQQLEQQAAMEAAATAAPDALTPIPSDSNFMSGGRSTGELSDFSTQHPSIGASTQHEPDSVEESLRPALEPGHTQASLGSISQLHIPGEFPKGTPP